MWVGGRWGWGWSCWVAALLCVQLYRQCLSPGCGCVVLSVWCVMRVGGCGCVVCVWCVLRVGGGLVWGAHVLLLCLQLCQQGCERKRGTRGCE